MKKLINPFGDDNAPTNPVVENESASLPERGTGLQTGSAGERRSGTPRTDAERAKRHESKLPNGLVRTEKDGYVHIHREGTEPPSIAKKPKSIKEQWRDFYKKHGR